MRFLVSRARISVSLFPAKALRSPPRKGFSRDFFLTFGTPPCPLANTAFPEPMVFFSHVGVAPLFLVQPLFVFRNACGPPLLLLRIFPFPSIFGRRPNSFAVFTSSTAPFFFFSVVAVPFASQIPLSVGLGVLSLALTFPPYFDEPPA